MPGASHAQTGEMGRVMSPHVRHADGDRPPNVDTRPRSVLRDMVGAMTRLTPVVLAILPALAGCAKSSEPAAAPGPAQPEAAAEPAPPGKPTGSETGGLGAPKVPWKDKTREQRMEYMGLFVLDRMHKLFAEWRSEEHTSELQSRLHLVCRLLLEKKNRE